METVNYDKIENQLWALQKACNRYKDIDPLANFVLFAVERYIMSNKAPRKFELDFINYPVTEFEYLIKTCLNGDRSSDGIIQTCRKVFTQNRR